MGRAHNKEIITDGYCAKVSEAEFRWQKVFVDKKKETFYSFTDKMNLEYEMLSEALAVVQLFLLLSPN